MIRIDEPRKISTSKAVAGDVITLRYLTDPYLRLGDVLDPPLKDDFSEYRFSDLIAVVEEVGQNDERRWFARCKLSVPRESAG